MAILSTLTTTAISALTDTTVSSGGNITDDGGGTISARGVCWNTVGSPTISDSTTTDGTGSGTFTSDVSTLDPNETYYLKAYATNEAGTAYGDEISFTTPSITNLRFYVDGGLVDNTRTALAIMGTLTEGSTTFDRLTLNVTDNDTYYSSRGIDSTDVYGTFSIYESIDENGNFHILALVPFDSQVDYELEYYSDEYASWTVPQAQIDIHGKCIHGRIEQTVDGTDATIVGEIYPNYYPDIQYYDWNTNSVEVYVSTTNNPAYDNNAVIVAGVVDVDNDNLFTFDVPNIDPNTIYFYCVVVTNDDTTKDISNIFILNEPAPIIESLEVVSLSADDVHLSGSVTWSDRVDVNRIQAYDIQIRVYETMPGQFVDGFYVRGLPGLAYDFNTDTFIEGDYTTVGSPYPSWSTHTLNPNTTYYATTLVGYHIDYIFDYYFHIPVTVFTTSGVVITTVTPLKGDVGQTGVEISGVGLDTLGLQLLFNNEDVTRYITLKSNTKIRVMVPYIMPDLYQVTLTYDGGSSNAF